MQTHLVRPREARNLKSPSITDPRIAEKKEKNGGLLSGRAFVRKKKKKNEGFYPGGLLSRWAFNFIRKDFCPNTPDISLFDSISWLSISKMNLKITKITISVYSILEQFFLNTIFLILIAFFVAFMKILINRDLLICDQRPRNRWGT